MSTQQEPGDIPAWQKSLKALTPMGRASFALALRVTERTVYNWSIGKRVPHEGNIKRIQAQIKKQVKA